MTTAATTSPAAAAAQPSPVTGEIKSEADRLWTAISEYKTDMVIRILEQFHDAPHKAREVCHYEINKIVFALKPYQMKDDFTCFHFAARKGQFEAIKAMFNICEDLDVNLKTTSRGWTPLHHAVFAGHATVVKFLIIEHADIDAKAEDGSSPLHVAISKGLRKMAGFLCMSNCDITTVDASGNSPLHLCLDINILQDTGWSEQDRAEMIDVLLMKGASITTANKNGDTPLHYACRSEVDERCLKMLMGLPDSEKAVKVENNSGHTPLHLAESLYSITLLLDKGADPNARAADQRTPLHMRTSNPEAVDILLRNGADPHTKDRQGRTALHVAMTSETPHVQSLRYLLKVMNNVNIGDNSQDMPLHLACVKEFTGPNVRAGEKSCPVVKLLLSRGAEVNAQNRRGQSPIFCAIKYKQYAKAHLLMEYGADPDLEDVRGKSARHLDTKFFTKNYKNAIPSEEEMLTEKYYQSPVNNMFNKKNTRKNNTKRPPKMEPTKTPGNKTENPLPKWVEEYSKSPTSSKPKSVPPSASESFNGRKFTHKVSQSSILVEVKDDDKTCRSDAPAGMVNLLPSWLDSIPDESPATHTTSEANESNTESSSTKGNEMAGLSRELTKLHEEMDEVKQFLEEFSGEGEATPKQSPAALPPPPGGMMMRRDRGLDMGSLDRQITSLRNDLNNVTKSLEEIAG